MIACFCRGDCVCLLVKGKRADAIDASSDVRHLGLTTLPCRPFRWSRTGHLPQVRRSRVRCGGLSRNEARVLLLRAATARLAAGWAISESPQSSSEAGCRVPIMRCLNFS
jgi:hypothetical protein